MINVHKFQGSSTSEGKPRGRALLLLSKVILFHTFIMTDYGAEKAVISNIFHSELYRIIILPNNTITIRRHQCFRTYDPDTFILHCLSYSYIIGI
jgi:hypothetical protein